ncbi:MAG: DNA polymerase [Candidatus Marinimicrobia bacterium]|nr:DNA polymerase [Candidatus Neomarinimicrobiota bacterium]
MKAWFRNLSIRLKLTISLSALALVLLVTSSTVFFVRDVMYWKDMADTSDLFQYYKYNALDTWVTGNTLLAMLLELPEYAKTNYLLEFPLVFPCHMAEMRGIKRDLVKLDKARKEADKVIESKTKTLNNILGIKAPDSFNVKSPVQMKLLFKLLGCKDLPSADAANLAKAKFRHPFNARLINLVLDIRASRTLKEKYLQVGESAKEFKALGSTNDTILYALNPQGTDSSRQASREHHFWCGLQVQNIPRGKIVKGTLKANEGFYLAEVDLEQAESRDTAYISGDLRLINAVENSPDFHSANASAFFGVPFNKIYDSDLNKVLDKSLRDLAKRVNHGANYNMGAYILVETMGEANITKAQFLLNLPKSWSYIQVAEHLLAQFHKTYPSIKKVFYTGVVKEVMLTSKLQHKVVSDKAWTRYCFGNPETSKHHLNSYISHPPQALNAQTLNKAWLAVFKELSLNPDTRDNIRVLAQIHDSILFEYRIGHEYLCHMVKELMEIPITIKGYDEEVRTFVVPAGIKAGMEGSPAIYWSETE